MKALRTIFIFTVILTVISAVGLSFWASFAAADADDKLSLALEPVFTVLIITPILISEFVLYRTVAFLFIRKERDSTMAIIFKATALCFGVISLPVSVCILFWGTVKLDLVFILPAMSIMLECIGSAISSSRKQENKTEKEVDS